MNIRIFYNFFQKIESKLRLFASIISDYLGFIGGVAAILSGIGAFLYHEYRMATAPSWKEAGSALQQLLVQKKYRDMNVYLSKVNSNDKLRDISEFYYGTLSEIEIPPKDPYLTHYHKFNEDEYLMNSIYYESAMSRSILYYIGLPKTSQASATGFERLIADMEKTGQRRPIYYIARLIEGVHIPKRKMTIVDYRNIIDEMHATFPFLSNEKYISGNGLSVSSGNLSFDVSSYWISSVLYIYYVFAISDGCKKMDFMTKDELNYITELAGKMKKLDDISGFVDSGIPNTGINSLKLFSTENYNRAHSCMNTLLNVEIN